MVRERLFHGVGEPSRFWVGVLVSAVLPTPDFLFKDFSSRLVGDPEDTKDILCVGRRDFNGL